MVVPFCSLRENLHRAKCTNPNCTIHWILTIAHTCVTQPSYQYLEHYPHPRCVLMSPPNPSAPPSLTGKHWSAFCFCRLVLLFLELLINGMSSFVLVFFHSANGFEIHTRCCVHWFFFPFYCWVLLRHKDIPELVSVISLLKCKRRSRSRRRRRKRKRNLCICKEKSLL